MLKEGSMGPSDILEKASREYAGSVCLSSHSAMMCKYWGPVWEREEEGAQTSTPRVWQHSALAATPGNIGKIG